MFDLFYSFASPLDKKYAQALEKVNTNLANIYKTSVGDIFLEFNFDHSEMVGMGRVASVTHPCVTEEDMTLKDFLWNKGFTKKCYQDMPPIERSILYSEWSRTYVRHEPTEWGKFLKRRRKGLNKDFGKVHEVLVKEIQALDGVVRGLIENIIKGDVFEKINFWELIVKRDRISDLESLYYDLRRDLHNDGWDASVCTSELLGNDGSVSYGALWMIDTGLWQVFDHYKVDPKEVMLKATRNRGWFPYASRCCSQFDRWWLHDWNPDFASYPEEWDLDEDEKHFFLGKKEEREKSGISMSAEELLALFNATHGRKTSQ